jgi:sigma-54-specific transcriptional regulator
MTLLTLPIIVPRPSRAKALVFEDPASQRLLERILQVAPSEATVLITGETGTGKEIVARHIHELSPRRHKPFVAVNCGAFSDSLVESDLFGHERGAFTGAIAARAGWFEAAHGGTLFLDEIGELQPALQVKLLRVLQEREVVRLGSRQPIPIDIRLIAATNADLAGDVARGRFRADLFYRLNVAALTLAPLRERPGDIVPLAEYFLGLYCQRLGADRTTLSPAAIEHLIQHAWPGNIRELENVIHHALVVCRGNLLTPEDLRLTTLPAVAAAAPPAAPVAETGTSALEAALLALLEQNPPDLYQQVEEALIRTAYRFCDRNQLQTARLLGISRNVVRARLIQFGELAGSPRAPASVGRAVAAGPGPRPCSIMAGQQQVADTAPVRAEVDPAAGPGLGGAVGVARAEGPGWPVTSAGPPAAG